MKWKESLALESRGFNFSRGSAGFLGDLGNSYPFSETLFLHQQNENGNNKIDLTGWM